MYRIPIALIVLWIVVILLPIHLVKNPWLLVDPPVMAFVFAVPVLSSLACVGAPGLRESLLDGFTQNTSNLPVERRLTSVSTLRSMGSAAIAAGVLVFLGAMIATFDAISVTGGQGNPLAIPSRIPRMLLGPIYGLALKAFFFDVLAEALDGKESELGPS